MRTGGTPDRASAGALVRRAAFTDIDDRYDLITMIAVLHHLDLQATLRRIPDLLYPGGKLLVVGIARVGTARDALWDTASVIANPVVGMVKHPRCARSDSPIAPRFPVADPRLTFDEIRAAARLTLPGVRMRRRLFFRFTLEWTRPGC